MNQPRVRWGNDGFASVAGFETAHCIDESTREYIGSRDVWVSIGTGMPSGSFIEAPPPAEDGKAIVMKVDGWELVPDFRGSTAYNKKTLQPQIICSLGPLSAELTFTPPKSPFDVWSGVADDWDKDKHKENQWLTENAARYRGELLSDASIMIAALSDAIDPAIIANPDAQTYSSLLEWKQYRAELVLIDCTIHPIQWPTKPR